jgi:hypothetical protein
MILLLELLLGHQRLFPGPLQGARHQAMLRFHGVVLPGGPRGLIRGALPPPLLARSANRRHRSAGTSRPRSASFPLPASGVPAQSEAPEAPWFENS